jgi:hypothetical protein
VLAQLAHLGQILGPLDEIAPATRVELYGDLSDEVRQAVAPFGPKIYEHWHGFTR